MSSFQNSLPPQFAGDQDVIDRKRALADLLAKQATNPQMGQMVSGHYVAPNILTGIIGPALQAYLSKKASTEAGAATADLGQRYKTELASGMQNYLRKREGAPGQVLSDGQAGDLLNNDMDPGPLAEPVKADPRGAAVEALTSGFAPLQQLGQMDLQGMFKSPEQETFGTTPQTVQDPTTKKLVLALVGNRGTIKPVDGYAPKPDYMNVGNNVLDKADPTKPVANYDEKFGEPFQRGGDWYQKNLQTGKEVKLDNAPKTTVTVDTGNKAGVAFGEGLGKKRAEVIAKSYDDAVSATKALDAIGAARNDFAQGVKTGIAANIGLGLAKVGKALGLGDVDPTIANTESFRANMARQTLDLVKSLGAGTAISNADREFAEKAAGGSITLDDGAILRLMDVAQAAAANVVLGHKELLLRNADSNGGLPEDLNTFTVPLNFNASERVQLSPSTRRFETKPLGSPTPAGAPPQRQPSGRPVPLAEYLRSKGF